MSATDTQHRRKSATTHSGSSGAIGGGAPLDHSRCTTHAGSLRSTNGTSSRAADLDRALRGLKGAHERLALQLTPANTSAYGGVGLAVRRGGCDTTVTTRAGALGGSNGASTAGTERKLASRGLTCEGEVSAGRVSNGVKTDVRVRLARKGRSRASDSDLGHCDREEGEEEDAEGGVSEHRG